jgi:hypothetical protein
LRSPAAVQSRRWRCTAKALDCARLLTTSAFPTSGRPPNSERRPREYLTEKEIERLQEATRSDSLCERAA